MIHTREIHKALTFQIFFWDISQLLYLYYVLNLFFRICLIDCGSYSEYKTLFHCIFLKPIFEVFFFVNFFISKIKKRRERLLFYKVKKLQRSCYIRQNLESQKQVKLQASRAERQYTLNKWTYLHEKNAAVRNKIEKTLKKIILPSPNSNTK